ncbi:MAG TPA: transcription termination factor Rho [Candidatus Polarisedimenticolia bacterium]|nr:transcription termination factor Rho [Candidatus Polarisedimenticolia bacterium]
MSGPEGGGAPGQGRGRRRRRGRRWRRGRDRNGPPNGPPNGPQGNNAPPRRPDEMPHRAPAPVVTATPFETRGVLEILPDGGGFLRLPSRNYRPSPEDVYASRDILLPFTPAVPPTNGTGIEGIEIEGLAVPQAGRGGQANDDPRHGGRHGHGRHGHDRRGGGGGGRQAAARLTEIRTINGRTPAEFAERRAFSTLTSIDPFERIKLETDPQEISTRVIDILTPIGKGQRCLIVAPPRAGKTTLLQKIAAAISKNHPEIDLMVLLVDERPEEVTDMKRNVRGEVIASSSDEMARQHVSIARLVLERARRRVEVGGDVVILLDSLTRLARAHNAATPGTGRTLSGGLDARTMEQPRRLFGAARKAEEGGSLTVIATALIDTGSRMDDVIFQEFKGTGNMELVLDRALFEQRIYPAVDIGKSGTRKEEKLFSKEDLPRIHRLRRVLFEMKPHDAMSKLIDKLSKFPSNAAFLKAIEI